MGFRDTMSAIYVCTEDHRMVQLLPDSERVKKRNKAWSLRMRKPLSSIHCSILKIYSLNVQDRHGPYPVGIKKFDVNVERLTYCNIPTS